MARTPPVPRTRRGRRPRSEADHLVAERARRQHLAPATRLHDARDVDGFGRLVRTLQPVAPRAFTFPGTPPQLAPRVAFDDLPASEELRRRGAIVKGRFGGGNVAYVWGEDLPLFVAAYRRPADRLSPEARAVWSLLESEGPTVRSEMKALLEMPGRALSAALIELQRAFMVTELQYETEWDNAWALFDDEYPGVAGAGLERAEAIEQVLAGMLDSLAFASERQLADRSGFPPATVRTAITRLASAGRTRAATIDGLGDVWLARGVDRAAGAERPVEAFEAVLHPQDPLVLAERSALARRFGRRGVLAYVVIDGRFAGAALGRWGISPFDVDDVVLDPPYDREPERRAAIVDGLRVFFPPPAQRIRHWQGEAFEPPGAGEPPRAGEPRA